MRFVGQYIQSLISRFRNDVYLEDISTGTIVSGGNLGLDSNNKIVKATVSSSSGDITGVDLTAGTGIDITDEANTTSGDYSATIAVDVSDFMTNGGANRVLTATGTDAFNAEANLIFDSTVAYDQLFLTSSTSPIISIKSTNTTLTALGELKFEKDAADVGNGEYIGRMTFYGENNAGTPETIFYAQVLGSIADITDGQEAGRLYLGVAGGNDGSMLSGLLIDGDTNASGEIDVTIGAGAGSTSTVAGNLEVTTGLELGHSSDTTIARSSAGVITVEGKEVRTIDSRIHMQFSTFRDDISTDEHWIPIHSVDEKTTNTNEHIPLLAPYAGKLLELHYRVSKNTNVNSNTATFKLYKIPGTKNINTTHNVVLDTQVVSTPPTNAEDVSTNVVKVTFDSDAAFAQHDLLAISIQHGANKADGSSITDTNTKFYITTIWEYDLSSM